MIFPSIDNISDITHPQTDVHKCHQGQFNELGEMMKNRGGQQIDLEMPVWERLRSNASPRQR